VLFPKLTTQRLVLRQATTKDLDSVYRGLSDPEVIEFYGIAYRSKQEAKVQLEWYDYVWENEEGLYWMITEKESERFLGTIGYHNWIQPNRKAELSFWLTPNAWRKGIMTETLAPVLKYGFETMALNRVEALVEEANTAGSGILEKAGFLHEGTLRDCELKERDDAFISLKLYGLLQKEYQGK
jgi:[ribosomal protein S5]-alanine N-acetyltransferase